MSLTLVPHNHFSYRTAFLSAPLAVPPRHFLPQSNQSSFLPHYAPRIPVLRSLPSIETLRPMTVPVPKVYTRSRASTPRPLALSMSSSSNSSSSTRSKTPVGLFAWIRSVFACIVSLITRLIPGLEKLKILSSVQDITPKADAKRMEEVMSQASGRDDRKQKVILHFGASGRTGMEVLRSLVESNTRQAQITKIVVITRDVTAFQAKWKAYTGHNTDTGIDNGLVLKQANVMDKESICAALIDVPKIDHMIWTVGFRPQTQNSSSSSSPSQPQSNPLQIDRDALANVLDVLKQLYPGTFVSQDELTHPIFDFANNPQAVARFQRLDDFVMGGLSSSTLEYNKDGAFASFTGVLSSRNNGGFSQQKANFYQDRSGTGHIDLSEFDGLLLQVRGDGRKYKVNIKNDTQPESVFQIEFQTTASADPHTDAPWTNVHLPFDSFIPVRRSKIVYGDGQGIYGMSVDRAMIKSVSIVVSKVDIGGSPTPNFKYGPFRLDIRSITAYKQSKPRVVLLSSAAVTRPFWSERKKLEFADQYNIPIVKLNPAKILDSKLQGEDVLRLSDIPYTIIRPVGLNDDVDPKTNVLFSQGDLATGLINKKQVAKVIVDCLHSEEATFKTMEIRSCQEATYGQVKEQLSRLVIDRKKKLYPH